MGRGGEEGLGVDEEGARDQIADDMHMGFLAYKEAQPSVPEKMNPPKACPPQSSALTLLTFPPPGFLARPSCNWR